MGVLRKLIAITVLLFLALPAAVSAFALSPKSEANLPACCRKGGKHHCAGMGAMGAGASQDAAHRVSAPMEKCPFAPQGVPAGHVVAWAPVREQGVLALVVRESNVVAQAEAMRRISRERTRQTRGPPAVSLS